MFLIFFLEKRNSALFTNNGSKNKAQMASIWRTHTVIVILIVVLLFSFFLLLHSVSTLLLQHLDFLKIRNVKNVRYSFSRLDK